MSRAPSPTGATSGSREQALARPRALFRRQRQSRTRPRRYSRSASQNTARRRSSRSAALMNGMPRDARRHKRASTAAAAGPCKASSARSNCGSIAHRQRPRCRRRCARSASLRAALTTSISPSSMPRRHQIVEDAAGLVRAAACSACGPAPGACRSPGTSFSSACAAPIAAQRDLAHMRHVEQAGFRRAYADARR